ncbi:MAG: ribonuclease Z, partial [Flavobacteriales bacterium]
KEKSIICGPKNESLSDFITNFDKNYPGFFKKNIIVDLSKVSNLKHSEILLFLNYANSHYDNQTSFVIIAPKANLDRLPKELIVVPTLIEAMDIIELEEISRDLGF